ncbi:hypothetical protein LINGRAHAP2_LOCUS35093 [Linum grandiflorum]
MSQFYLQQNVIASCDEARSMVSISDFRATPLVCPKPRRLRILSNNSLRPLRWHLCHQPDGIDNTPVGAELLDLILRKEHEDYDSETPPYFCGSPPARAANPLIHDAQFRDGMVFPISPSSLLSPSACKGGGARMKYGLKPAVVRVEGFDCQNSRISATAMT